MMLLIVLMGLYNAVSALNTTQCCPSDQVVLKRNSTCWDPHAKSLSKINLPCNDTVKVPIKSFNYSIADDGTLELKYILLNHDEYNINIEYGKMKNHHLGTSATRDLIPLVFTGCDDCLPSCSYCIGIQTTMKDIELKNTEGILVWCAEPDEDEVANDAKAYCMIVSIIFLILTALVYLFIPELRDLLGKSIINFCFSSAIGFMIIIIMKLAEYSDMGLCATRGFLAYFFVIASFFWTNAISIQILLSLSRPHVYDSGWKVFKWYALYAWGCPVVLTTCMAIVNYHPGSHAKPGIGLNHCWFLGHQQWYYMYSVMAILIIANIIIFLWTLTRLWCHNFNSTHIKVLRYKFMLSLRLFILMGVPWIFEMIGSAVSSSIIWTILDIFNTLQGLLIFILLVVLRRRALKLMYKHGWLCCLSDYVEKHLAVVDDEEDIAEHTVDVGLEDNNKLNKNGVR